MADAATSVILGLTDCTLPMKALLTFKLTRLDLAFNSLQQLPPNIGELTGLRELWLNDNPYLVSVPISLSQLCNLRVLDLHNTSVRNIPREYAVMSRLNDIDLRGCPLKPSLQNAYANGKKIFFTYLRRKNDRRIYKRKLVRIFHDDIYPFEDVKATLEPLVNRIFSELKDKTTTELRKLIRHGARIFPEKIVNADPLKVRLEVERLVREDIRTQQTGYLQLKLRGLYADCSVDDAAHKAQAIYSRFGHRPEWRRLFGKEQKLIFPTSFVDLSPEGLSDRMKELEYEAFTSNIFTRLGSIYPQATDGEKHDLFEYFMDCCDRDQSLLGRNMEKRIPLDLNTVLDNMEEDIRLDFNDKEEEEEVEAAEEDAEAEREEEEE